MAEIKIGKHTATRTKNGLKITCACCSLPQATVKENGVFVTLSYHNEPHTNGWSVEDVEDLLAVMRESRDKIIKN